MKKKVIFAAAVGMLCAASLQAQETRPERPEPMSDSLYAATRTQKMVEDYALTPEQEGAVFNLNLQYAGKLEMRHEHRPDGDSAQRGERPDPRSMTEAQRQEFFQKMQERRAAMEERMKAIQENRKAYEEALKGILTKDQFKAYKKDQRKREAEMQSRMQRGPGMGGPGGRRGGFGGPGGGRGGFGGGFGNDD